MKFARKRPNMFQNRVRDVLQCYSRATQYDPDWYKAWHAWALANSEVVNQIDTLNDGALNDVNASEMTAYIIAAIKGFFRSIALRGKQVLQDTLRLLTLWFKYGDHEGFTSVGIVTWLEVVPQVFIIQLIPLMIIDPSVVVDHRSHSNAKFKHLPQHKLPFGRYWKATSSSVDLSSDCCRSVS
jgi:hypothetical protein